MIESRNMTPRACKLLGDIIARGGGQLNEQGICLRTGLSHGYFSAARAELIAAGLLRVERVGRAAYYVPLTQSVPDAGSPVTAGTDKQQRLDPVTFSPTDEPQYPRITGLYGSFDDWADALTDAFGDIDAEPSGRVVILLDGTVQQYQLHDTDDGLYVS